MGTVNFHYHSNMKTCFVILSLVLVASAAVPTEERKGGIFGLGLLPFGDDVSAESKEEGKGGLFGLGLLPFGGDVSAESAENGAGGIFGLGLLGGDDRSGC